MSFLVEHAKIVGLLFFFSIFVYVAFCTYRPGAQKKLQEFAFIPLKEETHGR